MTKEAVVLAGGLGTRLREVVQDVPKPMAPVAGRPFLDILLYSLAANGIEKVVLAVGHKHEVIQDYYATHPSFGLQLEYSIERELLGTGGAILQAARQVRGKSFFVLNGDTYFDVNLVDLQAFAEDASAGIALALKSMPDSDRYGSVVCDRNNQITSFREKQPGQKQDLLINGGVYYMKKQLLDTSAMPQRFSFETDFLQDKLPHLAAYGKMFEGTFIDIGVPEDYQRAQTLLKDVIR